MVGGRIHRVYSSIFSWGVEREIVVLLLRNMYYIRMFLYRTTNVLYSIMADNYVLQFN